MIKVLLLNRYHHPYNVSKAEIETFIGLKRKGIDITVVARGIKESLDNFRNNGITVIEDEPKSKFDSDYVKRIRKLLVEGNFDILQLMVSDTLRNGVKAAYGTKVKVVSYIGSTSVYWHDITAYGKFLNPRIDLTLCNSNHVYNHFRKQLLFNKHKAAMVYKCYDVNWFKDREKFDFQSLGIPKNSVIVTSVARNTRVKGVKYFIKSTYHLKKGLNVHFVLVGKDSDNAAVKKLVSRSPYKNQIHLLGYRFDAIEIINGSDIYVQTSLDEGLGRAIAEACVLKKPVVMTDAGGCTELIEEGKGGFISELKNPKSIADNIYRLIEDGKLREEMGNNAYNYIKENFYIEKSIEGVYKEYTKLLSANN